MQIIPISSPTAIQQAIQALSEGQLIIYPTETCYGIAADATNSLAVTRLLSYKGDRDRQVSIAVSGQEMADKYVNLNSMAANLYQELLPGPITIISDSLHQIDHRLESSTGTLVVRYPQHDFALALISEFGRPITATSANTSGRKEPYSLEDWRKYTSKLKQTHISLFLDAGKLLNRPTSTVVDTTLNDPTVLRQGQLTLPALSKQSVATTSPETTKQFASELITKHLSLTKKWPLIIALQGDLGAGKTQFAKGISQALNIENSVTSPTYTLMKEYPYSLSKFTGTLYHIDTWRLPAQAGLSDLTELDSTLNLDSHLLAGNILVLEWAGKANSWLNKHKNSYPTILINIDVLDESTRKISYAFSTPEWS